MYFVDYYAFKSARHSPIWMLRILWTHKIIPKWYFERYGQHKGVDIQGAYKLSEDFAFTFTNKTGPHHTGIRRSGITYMNPCQVDGLVVQRTQTTPSHLATRSPDLTVCDFFLCGFVKDNVYVPPLPRVLPELRERINTAIGNVT